MEDPGDPVPLPEPVVAEEDEARVEKGIEAVAIPRMLEPFVRFMEGFRGRDRLLVNVFAISMALWVPLIWWLAMTTTPKVEGGLPVGWFEGSTSIDLPAPAGGEDAPAREDR